MTARLHRLPNGVRVVCDPMDGLESLALSVVVRGGARWEAPARSGWAHLLEHMVFKGAGRRSAREIVEVIEQQGGSVNAATGYERTSFQVRCLKGGLPLALEVVSDLVRRPWLDAGDLDREKGVIAQEIAEADDAPDDRVFELAQAQAFSDQPLGRPILGAGESVGRADPAALSGFHRALYASERLVVSAAGAVEEDALLQLAEAAFGDAPAAQGDTGVQGDAGVQAPAPATFRGGAAVETRKLEQAHLVMLLPGLGARDPDYFVLRLFAEMLGGGMSSRLFQEVRESRGLAYAIDAYAESYEDTGVLGIYAGTAAADAAEAARVTAGQVAELAASPRPAELDRAKAQSKAHLFMARESPLSRAEQAAGQVLLFDRPYAVAELAEAIDAVAPADLARVASRCFENASPAVAVLGPRRAARAAEAFRLGFGR